MAIALVQSVHTNANDGVTLAAATAGNLLVFGVANRDNNAWPGFPTGFADSGAGTYSAQSRRYARFGYKTAAGGETTLDTTWNAGKCVAWAAEFSGVSTTLHSFIVKSNQWFNTVRDPGNLTLPSAGLLVSWIIDDSGSGSESATAPVVIAGQGLHNGVEGPGYDAVYRIDPTGGSISAGVTGTSSIQWGGATMAFLAAAASEGSPRAWGYVLA